MQKKWTVILAVVGLIVGLFHPGNIDFGVDMPVAIAFAVPWAIFFGAIGLAIDYFTRKK
jgi:Na+(H+)/acetate symporter ActP